MADSKFLYGYEKSASYGIEVVPGDAPVPYFSEHHKNDLEVLPIEQSPIPQYREPSDEKEVVVTSPAAAEPCEPPSINFGVVEILSPQEKEKKRRKRLILVTAIAAAVIVIAVLIGVLVGVLAHRGQDAAKDAGSQNSTASDSPTSSAPAASMTGTSIVTKRYLFPTAISWGYPHLEVVALTSNEKNSTYRKYRNRNATSPNDWYPKGNDFQLIGGSIDDGSSVSLRSRRTNSSISLYIHGSTGALYHKYHDADQVWTGSPNSWKAIGTRIVTSQPTVVSYDGLTDDIFFLAQGTYNTIQHVRWTNTTGWSSFENLGGGNMQFVPAAASWDGKRIDVFAVGLESNHLFHTFWNGSSWAIFDGKPSTLEDLGGFCTSSPVAVARTEGVLDVFSRGGDGGLWHLSYNGTWSSWTLISGEKKILAQPDVISWDANRFDIFAWGSDNSLLTRSFNATTGEWTPHNGFEQIGSGLSGPPKALSDATGSMHVFAYGQSNSIVWKHWNISDGGEWPTGDFTSLGTPVF